MSHNRRRGVAGRWLTSLVWASAVSGTLPSVSWADLAADHKQECLAASDRGQNERDEGNYRVARQDFMVCAREVCPRVVLDVCTKWIKDLTETMPTIVLDVKDEQGNDLSDVTVTFDGAPLVTTLDGRPVEVDLGTHVLRFERDGSEPVEQTLLLRAGQRARVVPITLRSLATPNHSGMQTGGPDNTADSPSSAESTGRSRLVTAVSLGVGAVAAVGIGGYFAAQSSRLGGEAAALRNDLISMSACSGATSAKCQLLNEKVHAQHDDAAVATSLFIGGGAVAVGALAAWLLWPAAHEHPPQTSMGIAPTQGGLALQVTGRFR